LVWQARSGALVFGLDWRGSLWFGMAGKAWTGGASLVLVRFGMAGGVSCGKFGWRKDSSVNARHGFY